MIVGNCAHLAGTGRCVASPFHHFVVPPPPDCGGGQVEVEMRSPLLPSDGQQVLREKPPGTTPLPTPVQGWVASAAMPEGVSCLRQLYERGAFYFLGAFLFSPAACSGLPLPPLRGPPTPDCGGGQVFFGGGRGAFPSPPQIGQPKADSQKPIADSW